MSNYYDRKGNAITLEQWAEAREDKEQCRVAETTLPGYWISTVWLGLDYGFGDDPKLIFETMVFPFNNTRDKVTDWGELDMDRYSTEEEAIAGHKAMVEKWSKPKVEG